MPNDWTDRDAAAELHERKLMSLLMIETPDRWRYPDRLPLERRTPNSDNRIRERTLWTDSPQLGVIMKDKPLLVLIDANMFYDRPEEHAKFTVAYTSARAIVEDGWLVA